MYTKCNLCFLFQLTCSLLLFKLLYLLTLVYAGVFSNLCFSDMLYYYVLFVRWY